MAHASGPSISTGTGLPECRPEIEFDSNRREG
jgi:hypothetical protein